ncbi:DBH-like monooxygenase protein 2 [Dendropsophus ebraccatus]|uniref:DBH-like monooxygenase protein 2 n=1 Tax=Dendropsophus ebraccatus TaxID=150705 RepID=UPI0038316754
MTSQEREDIVLLSWGYDREVQEISIEIQTPIASSIALGLAPDKSLNKTDFVVAGWNEHNESYFYDAHTEGDWPPVKDKSQDYVLLNLSRNDTGIVMRVWRKFFTCDHHDHEIENDTVRVMVVIGDGEKLELRDDNTFRKSIFFLELVYHMDFPEITFTYDFKLHDPVAATPQLKGKPISFRCHPKSDPNPRPKDKCLANMVQKHLVSDQDTSYACTFLPMPRVPTKHHIIRYEPIEDPDTIGIVHHILIYVCGNNTTIMSTVGDCYGSDARYSQCMSATFGWAVGGEPFDYPEDCGVSVGTPQDPLYVRIEIHYSNFKNIKGLKDSSGMRITYSPTLRTHDCATLMTGIFTFPIEFIPPGSQAFRNYGVCNTHLLETSRITTPGPPQGSGISGYCTHDNPVDGLAD